jgi:(p)ppGpp synthase/HD superfamily hydrolase
VNHLPDVQTQQLRQILTQLSAIQQEATALQRSLQDLDDIHSNIWRQATLDRVHALQRDSKLVLGVSLALRIARLQSLSYSKDSKASRQQLAMESLQLWAPLSYQLELSSFTPELELQSYMQLFPTSFQSFTSWYSLLHSPAQHLMTRFRSQLLESIDSDVLLAKTCEQVIVQSRFKSPLSAFKKMLKHSKLQRDLYDILGIRVIVHMKAEATAAASPNTSLSFAAPSATSSESPHEQQCIERVRQLILRMSDWIEDGNKFKDYVTRPKPSGYDLSYLTSAICMLRMLLMIAGLLLGTKVCI